MQRKVIRLSQYDYAAPGYYFITSCTKNKQCYFGKVDHGEVVLNSLGKIVVEVWQGLADIFAALTLDEFIVMPNHVLCLVKVGNGLSYRSANKAATISQVVGALKSKSNFLCRKRLFPEREKIQIWQKTFYDRVIRDEKELLNTRQYIRFNAQKWKEDEYYRA